jgi:hypothetical protein
VAQKMATSGAVDLGHFDKLADHATDHIGVEWLAVAGEEERGLVGVEHQPGADFVKVAFQPCKGAGADGNNAVFVAFALEDLQGAAFTVEIVVIELGKFAAADSGAVKEFEHGTVAEAPGMTRTALDARNRRRQREPTRPDDTKTVLEAHFRDCRRSVFALVLLDFRRRRDARREPRQRLRWAALPFLV